MKILLPQPAARRLIILSGTSCLVGWLLGSQSVLLATSSAECVSKAGRTLATPPWPYPDSLDALVAAPKFHRVLFENERVRVLEVTVPPHQREPVHTHRWPSVIYRPAGLRGAGRYYDAGGRVQHEFTTLPGAAAVPARARWQAPEGPHAVENTGEVADRFIRVELKQ